MSTPQNKSTPPSYTVQTGGKSAAGKSKTPTGESGQKATLSVESIILFSP